LNWNEAADKIGMLFSKLENRPVERSARIAGAYSKHPVFRGMNQTQGSSTPRRSGAGVGMTLLKIQVCQQSEAAQVSSLFLACKYGRQKYKRCVEVLGFVTNVIAAQRRGF